MYRAQTNCFQAPSFSFSNRLGRALWGGVEALLFRTSLRPMHAWRAMLLRLFGAKLGTGVCIYRKAKIWAPWNLTCGDYCKIADEAIIYNPSPVVLGAYAIISQQAYLCGASHDYEDPNFPLISDQITVGERAWVCARASVQMGVRIGEGAVLGLGAVATRDLNPWTIYAGIPARPVKLRKLASGLSPPLS